MQKTTSTDGTTIAFENTGSGAPVVFVMGAFNDRHTGAALAERLSARYRVFCYDRRGRGDSGDRPAYAIERELEDLDAVLRAAGGSAAVLGFSSGAWLALQAAARGARITQLALFEAPPLTPAAPHVEKLSALIAAGRRGDAVEYFQRQMVGIPEHIVAELRNAPFRPALEAMAHTLVYDATLVRDSQLSDAQFGAVRSHVLALAGRRSPAFMSETAGALARALPNARALTLDGIGHDLVPDDLGPALEEFFATSLQRLRA